MRECSDHEITIRKLLQVVHRSTTRIRISVVMGDAWLKYPEAKRMKDFYLTDDRFGYESWASDAKESEERLLRYYGECPVWNLVTYLSYDWQSKTYKPGIEVHCHYKDIRGGYLKEKQDTEEKKKEVTS